MYIFFYVEIKNKNKSTTRNICNIHLNFFSCLLCGVKLLQNKRKNTISEMLYIVSTLKSIQMNVLLLHGCSLAFFCLFLSSQLFHKSLPEKGVSLIASFYLRCLCCCCYSGYLVYSFSAVPSQSRLLTWHSRNTHVTAVALGLAHLPKQVHSRKVQQPDSQLCFHASVLANGPSSYASNEVESLDVICSNASVNTS